MLAVAIAGYLRDMAGVVAVGAPDSDPGTVYLVMRTDHGFKIVVMAVMDYGTPEWVR